MALILALLILTGTLASWYSPFGWVAWGPRLMLPVLPAVVLVALVLHVEGMDRVLHRALRTGPRLALSALVTIAAALPEVNVLHAGQSVGDVFAADGACPTAANVLASPDYYYHCLSHWASGRHWALLDTFHALRRPWGIVFAVGFIAIWATLIRFIARPRRAWRIQPAARPLIGRT